MTDWRRFVVSKAYPTANKRFPNNVQQTRPPHPFYILYIPTYIYIKCQSGQPDYLKKKFTVIIKKIEKRSGKKSYFLTQVQNIIQYSNIEILFSNCLITVDVQFIRIHYFHCWPIIPIIVFIRKRIKQKIWKNQDMSIFVGTILLT